MSANSETQRLTVTSAAFTANGPIPVKYSCQGAAVNPPLQVTNIPPLAKTLALIVHDPDAPMAGGMTHWVAWNIPIDGAIAEDTQPGMIGKTGKGDNAYIGMCPPSGTHHYHFKFFALDSTLDLDRATDKAALEKAMKGRIIVQGDLVGLYTKKED